MLTGSSWPPMQQADPHYVVDGDGDGDGDGECEAACLAGSSMLTPDGFLTLVHQ
ncbi:MAG: hypothetical protein HC871_01675 [Rhizobiales bacterium]|nr:hypothetical protein [Hyphomicrobiales bacterium]